MLHQIKDNKFVKKWRRLGCVCEVSNRVLINNLNVHRKALNKNVSNNNFLKKNCMMIHMLTTIETSNYEQDISIHSEIHATRRIKISSFKKQTKISYVNLYIVCLVCCSVLDFFIP